MPNLSTFIRRTLTHYVRYEYLVEFEALVRGIITRIPEIAKAEEDSETAHRSYARRLRGVLIMALVQNEYGSAGVAQVNRLLDMLQICGSQEATDDLRTYAAARNETIDRTFSGALELALLHLLVGHTDLLDLVSRLASIKKSKQYQILTPDERALPFPLTEKSERDKIKIYEESQLSYILKSKGMTSYCSIEYDQYGDDFWFTISRGAYQDTEDEVAEDHKRMILHSANKGKQDIVIVQSKTNTLYINMDADSKMKWLVRAYAKSIANILYQTERWVQRNKYDLKPFREHSIAEIEDCSEIDGITSVVVYKLSLSRHLPTRSKDSREVMTVGFSGAYDHSVTESHSIRADGSIPEHFQVERAYFHFTFDEYKSANVNLAADTSSLDMNSKATPLIAQYFREKGFDNIYNRQRKKSRHEATA